MQTQNNQMPKTPNSQMDDDEINLMDILLVIAKYNRFILAFTGGFVILAFVYALRQPVLYTSNALIMPPQQPMSQAGALLGQLSSLGIGGASPSLGASLGILINSQKLAYQVVNRLKLQSIYKVQNIEAARNVLANVTKVTINKDGSILIECSDKDPKIAALLVRAYVEELDRFNNTIAVTAASRSRLYLEKQLKLANEKLSSIELAIKDSQKNTDFTPLELQTGSFANLVTTLRIQITSRELELTNLRAYTTEQNPQYRNALLSLNLLRARLRSLEATNKSSDKETSDIMKMSNTGSAILNNMISLKYQQALVENLKKQYDISKLDEAKNPNLIQVVNEPLIADKPSKPQREFIVFIGAIIGLIASIILAFIMNALDKAKQNPESAERLNLLRSYLLGNK